MTDLENFLENMRREIRQKAQQLKDLGKPHRFPCPYCTKDVEVEYKPDGLSYTLKHRVKGCQHTETPTARTRGDLVQAFVFHCRPKVRFGSIEHLEEEARKSLG